MTNKIKKFLYILEHLIPDGRDEIPTFALYHPLLAVFISILFARLIFPAIEQMRPCSPVAWWCWNSRQADHKRARHHSNPRPPLSTQMLDQTYNLSEDERLVRHICWLHTWHTVQYRTVQYSTVQYSTAPAAWTRWAPTSPPQSRDSIVQYSTVQYSTVQYSTVQYST